MEIFYKLLFVTILLCEIIAAITSYYLSKKTNEKIWKFFSNYLIAVAIIDAFGSYGNEIVSFVKADYYNYFAIPIQFVFFYWLYSTSLNNKTIFYISLIAYLLSFIPSELYFIDKKVIFSFNYTFGCLILLVLIVMEFFKQINSPDILNFRDNRMFYINLGITLFYIGSLPFFTFYNLLLSYENTWNIYYFYTQFSGIAMYLLFAASFIWGKQSS